MFDLAPQILFFSSFAVLVLLFIRVAPRVDIQQEPRESRFSWLIQRMPLERMDAYTNKRIEKWLRKARVLIMRVDNKVIGSLERVRHEKRKMHDDDAVREHFSSIEHEEE